MSRRESYGGGQSSLGYLFGSEDKNESTTSTTAPPPTKPVVYAPPYGIDTGEEEKLTDYPSPFRKQKASNSRTRPDQAKDPKSGNTAITGRPSTKVQSVPGGDSSLGYLFGDKS